MKDEDAQEYGRQMVALLRRLCSVDGEVSTVEKRWMRALVRELPASDITEDDITFEPKRLQQLAAEEGDAEELLEFLLLVSLSDGQTSAVEWKLIKDVAELVGVSAERLEEMRSTTVLTTEPE